MSADEKFLAARRATDRGAFNRWLKERGVEDKQAVDAAKEVWRRLPILTDPSVRELSMRALGAARGRVVDDSHVLHYRTWRGCTNVTDGETGTTTIAEFVAGLHTLAERVRAKGTGLVFEPVTNTDGQRINESTIAMHALFLDCDNRGTWDRLLEQLDALRFCSVAYQSGGWSPSTPKWRVVLFLAHPFDVAGETRRETWKTFYDHARVVFGTVGELLGEGFDPATSTPCNPWYLTERRSVSDPPRLVRWRTGHLFDPVAFMQALPPVPVAVREGAAKSGAVERVELDDDRLAAIVDKLVTVTSNVPANRRELYMSLTGALLDRGLDPDDVRAVIEGVSSSYPRPDAKKHADHMRIAETTIACFENDRPYTRIGTLNADFPEVAQVIDDVVPDPVTAAIRESLTRVPTSSALTASAAAVPPPPPPVVALTAKQLRAKLCRLLRKSKARLKRYEQTPPKTTKERVAQSWAKFDTIMLARLLDNRALDDVHAIDGFTVGDSDNAINHAMALVGRAAPAKTPFDHEAVRAVVDTPLARSAVIDFTPARRAFEAAHTEKRVYVEKRRARTQHARDFNAERNRRLFGDRPRDRR